MLNRLLLLTCWVGLCSSGAFAAEPAPKASPPGKHDWLLKHPTIVSLMAKTNIHRGQMGLGPVRLNREMCLAAQRHATWMADTGMYQHSGLPYAEIIFAGPSTPDAAVQGWVASPAHHGIMLSGTEVGFGYMVRNGRPYWVGLFR